MIGLKIGARGVEVERLHRILTAAASEIGAEEIKAGLFGPATLAALQTFQSGHGLRRSRSITRPTLEALLALEERITINIRQEAAPAATVPARGARIQVSGVLADGDGAPIAGAAVSLFAKQLRAEDHLGDATTDNQGAYAIQCRGGPGLNLLVKAFGKAGVVVAQSAIAFAVDADIEIDLTTAKDGIQRSLSQYAALQAQVSTQLHGVALEDLRENQDQHDLHFLAGACGASFEIVARLFIAHRLGLINKLQGVTLFGLLSENIPASLGAALANLPDAGIDDTFLTLVMGQVLAHGQAELDQALSGAMAANIIPASYAGSRAQELERLAVLRAVNVGAAPFVRGKIPLNDLMAAGAVVAPVQAAFVRAYADSGRRLGPTWTALQANKDLKPADLAVLQTTLNVGDLLGGNLPLVKDTLKRLSSGDLPGVQNLALLDQDKWAARIAEVDPKADSIPAVLASETPAQRTARLANWLASRFGSHFPTTAFGGALANSKSSSFAARGDLSKFLIANTAFNIKTSNIDRYVSANGIDLSKPALADLKAAQRLFRLSPHYSTVEALKAAGYTSAQAIYAAGRAPFLAQMTKAMGSMSLANAAYSRARATYATALATFGRYNLATNSTQIAAMAIEAPNSSALADLPSLQALFGSLDYCECSDCRSIFSPAAYVADLLPYLGKRKADGVLYQTALDALLSRRSDLQFIALNCHNTNVTLPYIDVANEVFEAAIAPPSPAVTIIDTAGTSEERAALPQNVSQNAYDLTAQAVYPLSLPFDMPFQRANAYLAALGLSRGAILSLFRDPAGGAVDIAIACANLGLSRPIKAGPAAAAGPSMQTVITGTDGHQPWERWGMAQTPASVIDPKTGEPYSPVPADWVAALGKVPVLLDRSGLSLLELYQLLEAVWVTQSTVALQLGTTQNNGQAVVSCDTDLMSFTGLSADVLDRANRFLRLWKASGLAMWELDWTLTPASALDDAFLIFLGGAIAVQKACKLPFQEVLSFWRPLETRDVTNHLGAEDVVARSTYSAVFLSPTVRASWGAHSKTPVFVAATGLSGNAIIPAPAAAPTVDQTNNLGAITAALGLGADDVAAALAASGAANSLSLDTLNWLLRYGRLATSLGLTVPDLVLWIELAAASPFGGSPNDTLEFLRRYKVLQATGLTLRDLDYLLRHQSVSQSSIAFSAAQVATVLQSLRDAVSKLAAPDAATVQTLFTQALVTATGASANVITPVLQASKILAPTAIAQTITQVTSADPTQVPALVKAVTQVAKAAALFLALRPSEGEFAFLIANAAACNWLDPSALPISATAQSPYPAFEALLRALQLDRRQPALSPKLFDVMKAWVAALPADLTSAISADFAFAMNANLADVSTIATALKATAPALGAGQAGTLADVAMLAAMGDALDLLRRYGIGATTLVQLGRVPTTAQENADLAAAATGVYQAQYASTAWLAAAKGVEDTLRQVRRDALVAFILGNGATSIVAASKATPIAVATAAPHGLQTGMQVEIDRVLGNTAANGTFVVTVTGPTGFTLNASAGDGDWTGGGRLTPVPTSLVVTAASNAAPIGLTTATPHGLQTGMQVSVSGVQGNGGANGLFSITVTGPSTFTLDGSTGTGAWTAGGAVALAALKMLRTADDIFIYYLIDPKMGPTVSTTRLLQASLSIQQFVGQCFLGLVPQVKVDAVADSGWNDWSRNMSEFQLWVLGRRVFATPENYLLPELRTDKSPFFSDLEDDLRQSNCDADAAATAFETYLRKLVEVSRLAVRAHYHETKPDGSTWLHVFAQTRGASPKWYYRTRSEVALGRGAWNAWQPLNLDIASDQLLPFLWDQRLHLAWPVFSKVPEKAQDQKIPNTSSGTADPATSLAARTFWAVEFAMSELSAGQWLPKRKLAEKMYLNTEDPPLAFTFKAFQDASYNLTIEAYHNTTSFQDVWGSKALGKLPTTVPVLEVHSNRLVATGTLSMPNAPLVVVEAGPVMASGVPAPEQILPSASVVDLSHEPSFALVTMTTGFGSNLPTPTGYSYAGQDLVFGAYDSGNPGAVALNVLAPNTQKLLGAITNPHIVVPQQEARFNSEDPFFVSDDSRLFFVQPHFWSVSNPTTELPALGSGSTWTTSFVLQAFYHPYAQTFLRELEIGGVDQLMLRELQLKPEAKSGWAAMTSGVFETRYKPVTGLVTPPYPVEDVDFSADGALSIYNWEIFYHVPMFVASMLMQNQQYEDAMRWLEYIFNPTDTSNGAAPQRFWQTKPFYLMQADKWLSQQIEQILTAPANTQEGQVDAQAIADWLEDPFDPHRVAKTRPAAYAKATLMKFLDNLIAWGDAYYSQYNSEAVGRAEQLYVLADLILGPKPEPMRISNQNQAANPDTTTYASLRAALAGSSFSDPLVEIENLVVAPVLPLPQGPSPIQPPALPQITVSSGTALYFCIPPNEQLLGYWTTVAGRLSNIRSGLNIQGIAQPLPLYAPAISLLQLLQQQAGSADASGGQAAAPIYRFQTYLQRAVEFTNDVRAYGALVLSALEKKDAETLAALRANQDLDIQTAMLTVRTQQVSEAQDQITVLQNQRSVVQVRHDFYAAQIATGVSVLEKAALTLQGTALLMNQHAIVLDMGASVANLIPNFSMGIDGFGGSPSVTASYGGGNIASAASSWAAVSQTMAAILSGQGAMTATNSSYARRADEWTLQLNLAAAELTQIDSQIAAATDRLAIATSELSIQTQQIANAQSVSDFLTNKYTNSQLYDWLLTQLSSIHTRAYQLAFSMAQQAQAAYIYELGLQDSPPNFIQFGYWDSQHRGLSAGDGLLADLRRMDAQYLAENSLELVVTTNISLALQRPQALVTLLQTGTCSISLDEWIFDAEHPGHHRRRLRKVGVTIPGITGPYTGIHGTLTLNTAAFRSQPPADPYAPVLASAFAGGASVAGFSVTTPPPTATIAISTGRNDTGQGDDNARVDDRWQPFEGLGAISNWTLELDPRDNSVDLSTVSDVVLHLTLTARPGGSAKAVRDALKPAGPRQILMSVRHTFSSAYNLFFNPKDAAAAQQTLTLPFASSIFPFSNLGQPKIAALSIYMALAKPAAGATIAAMLGAVGGPALAIRLSAVAGGTSAGDPIAALGAEVTLAAPVAPEPFALTISAADLQASPLATAVDGQARLDPSKIDDIVLIVTYAIS